jgi:hypothetical protein
LRSQRRPGRPWIELHAPAGLEPPAWCGAAGWLVVAGAALTLGWIAFRLHVVGDYATESDFYGGYAEGARLIQRGRIDFSRYPVVGPGYEVALALVGFLVRDLFTAARLISVGSAVGTLLLWRAIVRRLAGADVALWTIAFLAVNAVFVRYGYSATTDLLAIVLQAAALHATLASTGRLAPLRSGLWAALATFTRYNSIYLVPAALACYAGLAPAPGTGRRRAAGLHLAGFALIAVPWIALSLASGHAPGASLFERFGSFYMVTDVSRNTQDQFAAFAESLATARSLGRVMAHGPFPFLLELLSRVPDHLRRDALDLLGPPTAIACLAGLVAVCFDGLWRRLLPVWVGGALLFGTLVPVFYSDRYSMAIVPAYATLAAAAVASRRFALRIRPGGIPLKWLAALVPIVLSVNGGISHQKEALLEMPVEVLEAGRALARAARPGDGVMSRKGHIAYYSGCTVVPFPRLGTLSELGGYCRRRDVRFIYFSVYEASLRPEFAYLLDTSAVIPGLTVLHRTERHPAVLYRVGSGFGREPPWLSDARERSLHFARAYVQFMPGPQAAPSHVLLAGRALDAGDPAAALSHLDAAQFGGPLDARGWQYEGEALRALGRMPDAAHAYENALRLDPGNLYSRLGLGWAYLGVGDARRAAEAWRPAVGPRTDAYTLRQMVKLYGEVGDAPAAAAAKAALANRGGP